MLIQAGLEENTRNKKNKMLGMNVNIGRSGGKTLGKNKWHNIYVVYEIQPLNKLH